MDFLYVLMVFVVGCVLYFGAYLKHFYRLHVAHHEYGHAQAALKYTNKVMMVFPFEKDEKHKEVWEFPITSHFLSPEDFKNILCSDFSVGAAAIYDSEEGKPPLSPEACHDITKGAITFGQRYIKKAFFKVFRLVTIISVMICLLLTVFNIGGFTLPNNLHPVFTFTARLIIGIIVGIIASAAAMLVMGFVLNLSLLSYPSMLEIKKLRKEIDSCERNGKYSGCPSDATKLIFKKEYATCINLINEKGLQRENGYNVVKEKIEELQKKSDS